MHILEIPIDVFALPISELPHLLAGAMYDAASEDENESLHYGLERVQFDGVIQRAVQSGLLQPRAPGACVPVPFAGAGSVVTVNDLVRFLADIQCSVEIRRTKASAQPQAATPAPVVADSADDGEAWKAKARERADEIIKRQRAKDLHPSQEDIADEIAREFRADGVMGAGGKPLTGAYIKRHALKGISSAQNRQLSTSIRRGK